MSVARWLYCMAIYGPRPHTPPGRGHRRPDRWACAAGRCVAVVCWSCGVPGLVCASIALLSQVPSGCLCVGERNSAPVSSRVSVPREPGPRHGSLGSRVGSRRVGWRGGAVWRLLRSCQIFLNTPHSPVESGSAADQSAAARRRAPLPCESARREGRKNPTVPRAVCCVAQPQASASLSPHPQLSFCSASAFRC
jgi:hypothetical protein